MYMGDAGEAGALEARNGRVTSPETSADILGVDLHVFTNTCMQYVACEMADGLYIYSIV